MMQVCCTLLLAVRVMVLPPQILFVLSKNLGLKRGIECFAGKVLQTEWCLQSSTGLKWRRVSYDQSYRVVCAGVGTLLVVGVSTSFY